MKRIVNSAALIAGLMISTANAAIYELTVEGLACPFCAYGLERQLTKIGGIEDIAVDIGTGVATVRTEDGVALDRPTAEKAVKTAGFTLKDFDEISGN